MKQTTAARRSEASSSEAADSLFLKSQKTILREGSLSGKGLHTGEVSTVFFKPAPVNSGICFFHDGVSLDYLRKPEHGFEASLRCTAIGTDENQIKTVEHLLAALSGLGITNIQVHVDGPEIPGLDGSSLPFAKFFRSLAIRDQQVPCKIYKIREPIFCHDHNKAIAIYPSSEYRISYVLDYPHPDLKGQSVDLAVTPETFEKEIAPARTFCTENEALSLQERGFGAGANYQNTLVFGKNGVIQNELRFKDECARHKMLDIVGDLSLLGFSVLGHVVGIRSGHALNAKLVEEIKKQRETMTAKKEHDALKPPFGLEEIKKILPHRYPFLLVDRILEIGDMTAVGLKNVSANEPFFQGHFPERAIMPGVLIIEALAQVGGVMMLIKSENRGKLAYFMSIEKARFRKTVVPGDQLRLEIKVTKMKSKIGVVQGVAKVNGEEVCDAEFMFALVE